MADESATAGTYTPIEQQDAAEASAEQQSAEDQLKSEFEAKLQVVNISYKDVKTEEFESVDELAQFFADYIAEETAKLNEMKSALIKKAQNPSILKKWMQLVCEASKMLIKVDLNLKDMIKRRYVDPNEFHHSLLMHKAYTMTITQALNKPELYMPQTQRFKFAFPDRNGQFPINEEYEIIEFLDTIHEDDENGECSTSGVDDKSHANDDGDKNEKDDGNNAGDADKNAENDKNNENNEG